MSTQDWSDDRLTAADAPEVIRHCAGPDGDADRYEFLGAVEGTVDEVWHVLDRRAPVGEALRMVAVLRGGTDPVRQQGTTTGEHEADGMRPAPARVLVADPADAWRARAAALSRVHHPGLARVLATFTGAPPHPPAGSAVSGAQALDHPAQAEWSYAVVEHVAGRPVAEWVRDDPRAGLAERLDVLVGAAALLDTLHRGEIGRSALVHGGVTPQSLRLAGSSPADGVLLSGATLGLHDPRLPRPRDPAVAVWMAPEVRAGGRPSEAADAFGLAASAVYVLTGSAPVMDPRTGRLDLAGVRRQLAAAPLTADLPRLGDVLVRALDPDPGRRPGLLLPWAEELGAAAGLEAPAVTSPAGADRPTGPALPPLLPVGATVPADRPTRWSRRPVVVVAGAIVLATSAAALAVTIVQSGQLRDVPNPVDVLTRSTPTSSSAPPSPGDPVEPSPPQADGAVPSSGGGDGAQQQGPTGTAPSQPAGGAAPGVVPPAPTVPDAPAPAAPPAAQPPAAQPPAPQPPVARPPAPRPEPPRAAPPAPRPEPPRAEPPAPRPEPPRADPPRADPPRADPPRGGPPREDPPRGGPPREDPPRGGPWPGGPTWPPRQGPPDR